MTHFKETFLFNDFDLVWKNLIDQKSSYLPVITNKMNYPVDIYTLSKYTISKLLSISKKER